MGRRKGPAKSSQEGVNWESPSKLSGVLGARPGGEKPFVTPEKQDHDWRTRSVSGESFETPDKLGRGIGSSGYRARADSGYSANSGKGGSTPSKHRKAKPASKGDRETNSAVSSQADAGTQRRPKEDVANEIAIALRRSPRMEARFYDKMVRQWLHAIHGPYGQQGVHDALLMVEFYTSKKKRDDVRNWPAYMSQLLKKYFESLQKERRHSLAMAAAEGATEVATAMLLPAQEDAKAEPHAASPVSMAEPEDHRVPSAESGAAAKCLWQDRNLKVPDRVQVGQLLDRELHSEFICRVCLELCQDAVMLPCSHMFCRDCTRTLAGRNASEVSCPACRATFAPSEVDVDAPMSPWLKRWIGNMQVCCVFASREKLPDAEEDPLPPKHAARTMGLHCDWIGPAASYSEHICKTCDVAAQLRKLQLEGESRQRAKDDDSTCSLGHAQIDDVQREYLHGDRSSAATPSAASGANSRKSSKVETESPWSRTDTGDFTAMTRWSADCHGASSSTVMSIEAGDHVYISRVDPSGWAEGTMLPNGPCGWLPYSFCRRREYTMSVATAGGLDGYLSCKRGDKVVVYYRDMKGWAYGARLNSDLSTGEPGWLSEKAFSVSTQ